DDFQAVVAIPKQIVVAKEEPRAQRRLRCAKFGKDRLCRSAKRRAWQRLEINGKAAPSILLPPFPNWITLHSHPPLAAEVASTGFRRDPLTVDSQHGTCRLRCNPYMPTRPVTLVTGCDGSEMGCCANYPFARHPAAPRDA